MSRKRMKTLLVTSALVLAACALGAGLTSQRRAPVPSPAATQEGERRLTIFYTSAVQGTLEPCGCNSDPLGGIERFAALVQAARKTAPTLIVDGGNLGYPTSGLSPIKREAADLRAKFVAEQLTALGLIGSGLGAGDLARGPERVAPARLAVNLKAPLPFVAPSRIDDSTGVRVGVFGLVAPAFAREQGWPVEDPALAATREAARLREAGAELVIALAPLERPLARKVARMAAVDFVILGHNVGEGLPRAEAVGDAFLLAAGEELQRAGRLDIVLRPQANGRVRLQEAGGETARRERLAALSERAAGLAAQIEDWQKQGAGADAAFVARKRGELAALRAEHDQLAASPWQAPAGSFFSNRVLPIRRALPQDADILAAMRGLDRAIATVNLANATPPPKAEKDRAHFVGDQTCARCHEDEAAYWRTTVHARAWKTLIDGGKQHDLECVGCHVTGYGEVGGSALGFTQNLEAVQCETCHGPGSQHVDEEGLEEPVAVRLDTPETTCKQCHNEKHSDTFDYQAYLRDILGPGHGEKRRQALGPGPTGHELRSAAMEKAKKAGLAQSDLH